MLIPSRVFFSFQLLYSSVLTGSFLYFLILYHCGPLFFSQVHEYPIDHYFKFFIFTISIPLKDFHGGTGLFFHLEHISLPLPFLGGPFCVCFYEWDKTTIFPDLERVALCRSNLCAEYMYSDIYVEYMYWVNWLHLRCVLDVVSLGSCLWGYLGRLAGGIWGRHKLRCPRACSSECTLEG